MAKKILDFSGLKIFKDNIVNLFNLHINNSNVHLSSIERKKLNNFPTKLSDFENDAGYLTINDFKNASEYDGGDSFTTDPQFEQMELDGGNSEYSA